MVLLSGKTEAQTGQHLLPDPYHNPNHCSSLVFQQTDLPPAVLAKGVKSHISHFSYGAITSNFLVRVP